MTADPLFTRTGVSVRDERIFVGKLVLLAALVALGAVLALAARPVPAVAGMLLLGAMYTHATELAHQCLHHSAFRRPRPHRVVGVLLGLPLLVVYSHYRLRHLQHHRHLGTPADTEFFGFDTRHPITVGVLLRTMLDYRRPVVVVRDVLRCATGRWRYEFGEVGPVVRRRIVTDHLVLGGLLLGALATVVTGHGELVLLLWLLPLLVAVPMHFLVELPEHVLCEPDTTDVLRNTRSIGGSRVTTWFTNGNNLHVEHHAAMTVPMNRLRDRHDETRRRGRHVEDTYLGFCRTLLRALRDGRARAVAPGPAPDRPSSASAEPGGDLVDGGAQLDGDGLPQSSVGSSPRSTAAIAAAAACSSVTPRRQ